MTPVEVAAGILRLYGGDPERWTRYTGARDQTGRETDPCFEEARCWCIFGAMDRVLGPYRGPGDAGAPPDRVAFVLVLQKKTGSKHVFEWNDHPATTFAAVERVLKEIVDA